MTVSYQYDVASSSTGGFFRLLWRWRGSIWKLLYKELLLFVCVYICIAFTYDFLMSDYYKRYYEHIVIFCSAFVEVIPLSFILGFYVSFTAHRWWQQYTAIPWPDKLMNIIALYIPGNDVTSRVLRRTLMRYLNLTLVLVLRSISIPVKRRFPTKEHLVEAGFMSRPELEIYQSVPSHEFNTFWIPCTWFVNLLREAKSECRITDSGGIKLIMEEFNEFRSKCGLLWSYDWVSIPLVYTQVVTLSTQAFFLASLLGRQHINPSKEIKSHIYGEYYIPIFTMLQFILYMGLLKLGEQLINPFGDDDEDFELNWIIDRHLKVSFLGVDILNSDPPPLIKDNYFDDMDIKLPYTEAAVAHKVKTYRGSVAAFHVPTEKHGLVIPEFEDDYNESTDDEPSTTQSNRDAVSRNNSWSLFGQRKRKFSSSIDSFNSETMVEHGLSDNDLPELVESIQSSSWPTFLQNETTTTTTTTTTLTGTGSTNNSDNHSNSDDSNNSNQLKQSTSSKLSVWPSSNKKTNEKANEDTQGIRWNENKDSIDQLSSTSSSIKQNIFKQPQQQQSSFSTSDSSIVIPLDETTNQWNLESNSSKIFRPRRHSPLQVFSKDLANAPISVFNQILESNLRRESKNSCQRSSLSSLSSRISSFGIGDNKQQQQSNKPYKSLIKCQRTVDPKLRIRPFRSKVTFSDDTKSGDNNSLKIFDSNRQTFSNFYDSSSESNSSLMRNNQQQQQQQDLQEQQYRYHHRRQKGRIPTTTTTTARKLMFDPNISSFAANGGGGGSSSAGVASTTSAETSFVENCKRRQSLDPTLYRDNKDIIILDEIQKDNWLHYQSLPNIQEEDYSNQSSLDVAVTMAGGVPTTQSPESLEQQQQQQQNISKQHLLLQHQQSSSTSSTSDTVHYPSLSLMDGSSNNNYQQQSNNHQTISSSINGTTTKEGTTSSSKYQNPNPMGGGGLLLSPELKSSRTTLIQSPKSTPKSSTYRNRNSFKRQKSQEIADEDLINRLNQQSGSTATTTMMMINNPNNSINKIIKQSSDDSQTSSTSINNNKSNITIGILKNNKKQKEDLKQASTESDTGSYHTVKSLVMHSSIDSFTSAVSDPVNSNSGTNSITTTTNPIVSTSNTIVNTANSSSSSSSFSSNSNSISKMTKNDCKKVEQSLTEDRLKSYQTIELNLVPKIIFSQSTPSVTSQSSDDQNSPKWDENYTEFSSSIETVIIDQQQQQQTSSIDSNPNDSNRSSTSILIPTINIDDQQHSTTTTTNNNNKNKSKSSK